MLNHGTKFRLPQRRLADHQRGLGRAGGTRERSLAGASSLGIEIPGSIQESPLKRTPRRTMSRLQTAFTN